MLLAINNAPPMLKFLIAVGLLEMFFTSSLADRVGIDPHLQVPIFLVLVIAVIIWIIFGERRTKEENAEPAE